MRTLSPPATLKQYSGGSLGQCNDLMLENMVKCRFLGYIDGIRNLNIIFVQSQIPTLLESPKERSLSF